MFLARSLDSKLWSVLSPFQYYLVNAGCKIVLSPIPSFISRSTSRRASARVWLLSVRLLGANHSLHYDIGRFGRCILLVENIFDNIFPILCEALVYTLWTYVSAFEFVLFLFPLKGNYPALSSPCPVRHSPQGQMSDCSRKWFENLRIHKY